MSKPTGQILPESAAERKEIPLATGCLDYFPLALAAVAQLSKVGNDQHNPGQPLHWSREKSSDHDNCILRHMLDRGRMDSDGQRHSTKVAWRALAMLQLELENAVQENKEERKPPARTTPDRWVMEKIPDGVDMLEHLQKRAKELTAVEVRMSHNLFAALQSEMYNEIVTGLQIWEESAAAPPNHVWFGVKI